MLEEFAFHIELWSNDDLRVDETLALARNIRVAQVKVGQKSQKLRQFNTCIKVVVQLAGVLGLDRTSA